MARTLTPGNEVALLPWRQGCGAARGEDLQLPQAPHTRLAQAVQKTCQGSVTLWASQPALSTSGPELSSWAQPNKGCLRCQQIPGNEPGMYRGLPSPTSWRGTQQPLKLITKYAVFTQKAFMAFLVKHMRYLGSR